MLSLISFAYLVPNIPKTTSNNNPITIVTPGTNGAPTIIAIHAAKDLAAKLPKNEKPILIPVFNNNFFVYNFVNFHLLLY
jgi:hypothetical protein